MIVERVRMLSPIAVMMPMLSVPKSPSPEQGR
jgi:hypothetical protein